MSAEKARAKLFKPTTQRDNLLRELNAEIAQAEQEFKLANIEARDITGRRNTNAKEALTAVQAERSQVRKDLDKKPSDRALQHRFADLDKRFTDLITQLG